MEVPFYGGLPGVCAIAGPACGEGRHGPMNLFN